MSTHFRLTDKVILWLPFVIATPADLQVLVVLVKVVIPKRPSTAECIYRQAILNVLITQAQV